MYESEEQEEVEEETKKEKGEKRKRTKEEQTEMVPHSRLSRRLIVFYLLSPSSWL